MARTAVTQLQNWLTYSEQFDNAAWTKQAGVVVTADQAVAPDGTTTADLLDFTAAGANTGVLQVASSAAMGKQNTKSVWLKGVLGTEVVTLVDPSTSVGVTTCNLTTSWQRFTLTEAAGTQPGNAGLWIRKSSGNQCYAWGAQLVRANWAGNYAKTTASSVGTSSPIRNSAGSRTAIPQRQNLAIRSEEFDSGWASTALVTVTANQAANPIDGAMTADKLDWSAGAGYHLQTVNLPVINGSVTFSVWMKGETKATIVVTARGATSSTPLLNRTVTLTTSWKKYSFTGKMATSDAAVFVGFENRAFAGGDQLGGVMYAWGAHCTIGGGGANYVVTTSAAVNTGNVRSVVGEQNLLTYSEQFDNAAWSTLGACTITADQAADPVSGAVDADLFDVTSGAAGDGKYQPVTLAAGTKTVTVSCWVRTVSGTGNVDLGILNIANPPVAVSTAWTRITYTATFTNTAVGLAIRKSVTSPANQLYVWGAQLVVANWAGAYAQTTGATVNTGAIRSVV